VSTVFFITTIVFVFQDYNINTIALVAITAWVFHFTGKGCSQELKYNLDKLNTQDNE